MTSSETPSSSTVQREFFVWKRIEKQNNVVEQVPKVDKVNIPPPRTKANLSDGIVPMIPDECWSSKIVPISSEEVNLKVTKQALNNPLVPLGMVATTGCLIGMCVSAMKKDKMKTQYYMRGRIAAQFFTFCVLFGSAWYLGAKQFKHKNNENVFLSNE